MSQCNHPNGKCNNADDCAERVCTSALREADDPLTRYLAANLADRWRNSVMEALPAMRAYANANPPHYMGDSRQDPNGVHAWLHKYDPSRRKQCGECHLQPGERCPVCGNDWHAEDCEFGKEVGRRLKAERDAHKLAYALENVAMMLRKCAHRLRCNGHEDLSADAVGLLRRLDLLGSPLRREFECLGEPIAALKKRLAEDPGFAAEVTGDKPPTPGCHTPEGCRENGCLGWCDEHRPEARAGVEDLQREVARLKVENARLAEETMRLQRLLNAAHQIVGELARPSGI